MVSNPARGSWSDAERWRVREVLQIGSETGGPAYQFGRIGAVGVGEDGTIYVVDRLARELRAFSPSGENRFTVGGEGAGPGEFRTPAAVLVGPGDTLFVPDPALQRVTIYSADGELIDVVPLAIGPGLTSRWAVTRDGGILHQVELPMAASGEPFNRIIHHHPGFEVTETVLELPVSRAAEPSAGGMVFRPFQPTVVWGVTAEGRLASALDSDFRIEIRELSGSPLLVMEKPFEAQRIGRREREAYTRRLRATLARDLGGAFLDQVSWEFGERLPAVADIRAGPRQTLWVERGMSAGDLARSEIDLGRRGAGRWDVLGADGTYLGVVELPAALVVRALRGNRIYGELPGPLETSVVSVWEIVTPTAP